MLEQKDNNNINSINIDNNDNSCFDIYVISCFHNVIWKSNLFNMTFSNKSVISINNKEEHNYEEDKNYLIVIHQIIVKNNYNDIEKISLSLSHKNKELSFNLGEIIIKSEEEKFFFNNLSFDSNNIKEMKKLNEEPFINNDKDIDYSLYLKYSIKLKIFHDFIEKNKMIKQYSSFLVNDFLSSAKNESMLYSDIITLFTLSHGNKSITTFFDNCYNFKFTINKFKNSNFVELFNSYFKNKNSFNSQNEIFFYEEKNSKKVKNVNSFNKYKKDIDNFMNLFAIFSKDDKKLDTKKLSELDIILMKILNNYDNILDYLNSLSNNFKAYYLISREKKEKDRTIKLEKNKIKMLNISEKEFLDIYSNLVDEQEKVKLFFIDTSEILENLIEILKFDLDQLSRLKDKYKKEVKFFPNQKLYEKINEKIHNKCLNLAQKHQIDNNKLLKYLIQDEYKDIKILEGFNTSLMDDKFIQSYNKERIYQLFEGDLKCYLSIFSKKIKHTKFFGLFFKLLPPEKYNLDTINVVLNWSENNIKTYNKEECTHFLDDLNIFLKILIKFGNQYVNQFIDIIKKNLNNYYLELFVQILNTNKYLNIQNKEYIIDFIININEDKDIKNNLNLENILYFTKNIKCNGEIEQIFLNKLDIYHLLKEDFYLMNDKLKLFTKLLNDENFTLKNKSRNKNTLYWDKTKKNCSIIYDDLKNLNIKLFNPLIDFFNEEKTINEALIDIIKCLDGNNPEKQSKNITSQIKTNLEKWGNKIKGLKNIIAYEDIFFKKGKDIIKNEIQSLINEISKSSIHEIILKIEPKLSKYNNDIEISKKRIKLNESLLFNKIFNNDLNVYFGDKKDILNISEKKFYKIENILECDINNIKVDEDNAENIKFLCDIYYNNQEDLSIEIDWIYNYFKKENSLFKEKLKEYIEIILKRKILKSIISGIIIFIDNFSNNNLSENEKDIYNNLKKYKNDLEINKNITLEDIKEIIDFLIQKMDINLNLDDNNKKLYVFLLSVSNSPESIQFIKDKKISEINNLTFFWVDSSVIPPYEKQLYNFINIVDFLEKLLYQNKEKSIFEIIKIIFQRILDDNIIELFSKYLSNYKDIKYLFDMYLKPTDICINCVKLLLEQSIFYLSLNEKKRKYEIMCLYACQMIKIENNND